MTVNLVRPDLSNPSGEKLHTLPCASEAGHYVDRTEFFNANNLAKVMTPATVKYYAEYPGNSGTYWAVPVEGDALGWSWA